MLLPSIHYPNPEVEFVGNMNVNTHAIENSHEHIVPKVVGADLIDAYCWMMIYLAGKAGLKLMLELSIPTNLNLSLGL